MALHERQVSTWGIIDKNEEVLNKENGEKGYRLNYMNLSKHLGFSPFLM